MPTQLNWGVRRTSGFYSEDELLPQLHPTLRATLFIAGTILAWGVFAIGMIAPLTPSEGPPSVAAVATFLGVPLLMLVALARLAQTPAGRLTQLAQATLMTVPVVAIVLSS